MGDRIGFLSEAVRRLGALEHVRVVAVSSVYETEPVEFAAQPDYLNVACKIITDLSPECLLDETQKIERDLGRIRTRRFGPRTVDIDILLFENEERKNSRLTIPHPRMYQRAFVLVPLRDILPDMNTDIPQGSAVRYYGEIDDKKPFLDQHMNPTIETYAPNEVEDGGKTDIMGTSDTDFRRI
ncbi:MAG: 2-amino-4-hydroxy-6-hydroxymethyldihydropteridine diphosphokinase [Clostridiales bacterium]|nr:2-amino-4-hydroxy-6-hydroxymethyldihydropteridine diphosphokinase [Clostridiales bacterium]